MAIRPAFSPSPQGKVFVLAQPVYNHLLGDQNATRRPTSRMPERKIRVLVAKPGLDGHDRGAKVIARALRDAGMEVIYTGLRQTPEMIAEAALQEDVDVVGLSILSGAHMALVPKIMDLLRQNGMSGTLVLLGGIVPDEDVPRLKELGVTGIFGPGASTTGIVDLINEKVDLNA
jgi:methylmalonyl-CoA mutase C-terminal domain/subunit